MVYEIDNCNLNLSIMKKIYSGILSFLMLVTWSTSVEAQCISTNSFASATINSSMTSVTQLQSCNYTNESTPLTVVDAGTYIFTSSLSGDFITITDASSSTVIGFGISGVSINIPTAGSYRYHIFSDASCPTPYTTCRAISAQYAPPSCSEPTAVTFSGVTNNAAAVSWAAPVFGTAATYEYVFSTDANPPVGAGTSTTSTSASFTGLLSGTTYTLFIKTVCGPGDESNWESYAVSTTCDPAGFIAPYSTSFESPGNGDPCWTQSTTDDFDWSFGGSTPSGSTGPSSAFDGSQFAYTESAGNSGDVGIFVSPTIDLSALTSNPTVRFNYHMFGTEMGSLDLEVESPVGSGNWNLVWSEIGNQGNEWKEAIVPLTPYAGQSVTFRFYGVPGGTTTSDMAVDNFSVENEFCVTPFDVIVAPQGLFADLSWTTLNADSVSIEYGVSGFTPGTGTVISGLTASSFRIFGLTELTNYQVYITAYCSSTGGTATTQAIAFSTPIACAIPTGGSVSSVDTDEASIQWNSTATTWDIEYGPAGFTQGTGTVVQGVSTNPYTITGLASGTTYDWFVRNDCGLNGVSDWSARFTFQTVALINCSSTSFTDGGGASGDYSNNAFEVTIAQPDVAGAQLVISFTSFNTEACCDDLTVYDGVGTSGTILGTYAGTNLPGDIITTTPITFVFDSDGSVTRSGFTADVYCTTCDAATGLSAGGITAIGADISWDVDASVSYNVTYGPSGFNPSTGGTTISGVTGNLVSLTGLSGTTTYDVYIEGVCSNGDVSPRTSISFTTADGFSCAAPIVVPVTGIIENFDALSTCGTSATTVCNITGNWTNIYSDNQDWLVDASGTSSSGTGPSSANSGSNYVYTESSVTTAGYGTYQAVLQSECFDVSALTNPYVNFAYHMYSTGQFSPMGTLELQVLTANLAGWTTLWAKSGDQGNQWNTGSVFVGNLGTNQMAFRFVGTNGGGYQSDIALDDIEIADGLTPGCLSPGSASFAGITTTSANVTWLPGGTETAWSVEVTGAGLGAGTGTSYPVSGAPSLSVTGLTAATNYEVWIQSTCGGPNNGPFAFSTTCAPTTALPYSDNFDAVAAFPQCWEIISGAPVYSSSSTYYVSPFGGIQMPGGPSPTEVIIGNFETATEVAIEVSWNQSYNSNDAGEDFYLEYNDGTQWVIAYTVAGGLLTSADIPHAVIIQTNGLATMQLRFRSTSTSTFDYYGLDDLSVTGAALCFAPSNVAASPTGNSVSATWNAATGANSYDVGVWAAGDDPDVDPAVSTQTGVTGTSATLSGLTNQTSYQVYVTSNCSGGTNRASAVSFTTPCATVIAPYSENFDGSNWNNLNTYDPCWNVESTTAPNWEVDNNTTGSSNTGPSGDVSGSGKYIFLETSGAAYGQSGYIETPFIDISSLVNPGVSFFYHMYGSATGTLEIQVNDGSGNYTTIWSLSGQQQTDELDPWEPASASLAGYSGAIQLRIKGTIGLTGNFPYESDMAIDELFVGNLCPSPSNVAFSNVYDTSIDVSWTGSASTYTVEIQPAGTPATGSGTSVSGTSTTLTGLTPSTDYVVYVYSDCGFATSAAASAAITSGYCPAPVAIPFSALPYSEGFDGLAAPFIPCGWLVDDANGDAIEWETQDRTSLSQSNPNALEITRNATADMDDWIFSPEFVVPANTSLDITFSYRVRTNQYVEKLEVFIGDGQTPADMNLQIFNVSNLQNSFYKQVTVSYTTTAAENIFIGLHGYSDANEFALYIDDFEVKEADCPTPFLLSAVATGQTSASLSWNGPGSNFEVEYGPAGFQPGTGTTTVVSSSPASITGLEVGADYDFYVTNNCTSSSDGFSQKAGPASFTTDCPSISASATQSCLDGSEITLTGVPAGGSFSGPGVSAGKFDPTSVQPGTYQISYRVTNAFGQSCAGTLDITVNPYPNVSMSNLGTFCTNQNGVTLTQGSPSGGTYSGPGVVGNQFVPSLIGQAGNYTLYYTYTNPATGCTAMDSASVSLVPVPNVTLATIPSFCGPNHPAITLNGSPAGGVYSGPGVTGNQFNPMTAGVGTHIIRYSVASGGCTTTAQRTVVISEVPTLTISPDITILYGTSTVLTAQATGGSGNYNFQWSPADSLLGNGTSGTVTTQNLTTPNDFVLSVTDNVSGCVVRDTVRVGIFGGPLQVFLSVNKDTICVGEQVELRAEVIGGSDTSYSFLWTPSTFVTDLYNDTTYSSPTQTTTYSFYVNDAFSQKVEHITVYVNDFPNVSFAPVASRCVDGADFALTQGSPAGGTYSGPGVTGGVFSPAAAGVGTHVITYSYANAGGCVSTTQRSITVTALPTVSAAAINNVCVNSGSFALSGGSPIGGTYSGVGVNNGIFNPSVAGVGTHTITYSLTNANGCSSSATTTVTVDPAATASIAPLADACRNGGPVTLSGGTPAGGTYSGPAVNNGVFYPSQVTPGSYNITYSYTDANGCSAAASTAIVVTSVPNVDMTTLGSTCSSAASFALTGGSPAGGTYSGPGVTGANFDPATAGVGTHVITYTYTNAGGCTSSATNSITVAAAPNVSLAAQPSVCVNGSMVLLSGGTPGGGTYSGTGVTNGMFDPSVAGTGSHTITYNYTSPEGCSGSATSTITVTGLPAVSVSGPTQVCKNGGLEPLAGSPVGGVFSGPGVQGSDFNPSIVAPGTYTVTYTYTDGSGCSNSSTTDVIVDPLPAAPIITQNGCVLTATSSITNANYSWFDQSGALVGTGATLTTPCVGLNVYTVEGQDPATGCSSISSEFVASYVGLDEELTAELIEVFPNPNRGEFTLSIEQLSASNVVVSITDARGRIILEDKVDHNNGGSFEKSFNLEQVESGVYFIRVSADGHSTVKRIVIEK